VVNILICGFPLCNVVGVYQQFGGISIFNVS